MGGGGKVEVDWIIKKGSFIPFMDISYKLPTMARFIYQ